MTHKYLMRYCELIFNETTSNAGIIKPEKPLTPAQQQRRQEKNISTQKRIRDEQTSSMRKINDLKADLT